MTALGAGPLAALFDPRSVAVVGASDNPAKWGYWLASGALAGRHRRRVHLVNRRGGALDGTPFLPDLAALPDGVEHVVVAVPPAHLRAVVTDGLTAGARCFTVITSQGAGTDEERTLARLVTGSGARLLGPNCMGVVDTTAELRLSWGDFPSGAVGLVSQSGNLALEIGRLLARAGQGFSRFVSLGNQRDIDATDALEALIHHEPTKVVAAYVEDFRDGRRLARALTAAYAAGKPVLLLTVGRSEASGRAAASHTGALVTARATVEAVCRDAGALLLESAGEVVDTAVCLLAGAGPGCQAVEAMASPAHAVELIAGVRHDPAFGPVLMAGIGGVRAELLDDVVLALAPLTPDHARALLRSLRHAPLLTGWRGAPAVDLDAAARALCTLARAAVDHPELAELEVNPLLVHPGGALALDAHAVLAPTERPRP
ncbi:acetate--CoA ligase family protein [Streptomyces sp. NPDC003395]